MATNDTLGGDPFRIDGIDPYLFEAIGRLFVPQAFTPLYTFMTKWLGGRLVFLFACLCLVRAGIQALTPIYDYCHWLVMRYFTSTVTIYEGDDLFNSMMKWLSTHPQVANSRRVLAVTKETHGRGDDEDFEEIQPSGAYPNFSKQGEPPMYVPAMGAYYLIFRGGRCFVFSRVENAKRLLGYERRSEIVIWCFGPSTEPIKRLLAHAKHLFGRAKDSKTTVFRPRLSHLTDSNAQPGALNWMRMVERPIRQMRTVVLDKREKKRLCNDMKEFLSPVTAKWYANRGIALRRGYIFYGPPGTGKTSLVYALAGLFGLDIYVVSLQERTMNESILSILFNSLPRYCVILLEDIDAVGTTRPAEETANADKPGEDVGNSGGEKTGLSLSGLLNVLDGVATQEGRILIMTTNRINALDKALIRPGRVDFQVPFKNATKKQAGRIFTRIYEGDRTRSLIEDSDSPDSDDERAAGYREKAAAKSGGGADRDLDIPIEKLREKIEEFREKVPEGEFTPAEIQAFLLQRKWQPGRAVREADEWAAALRKQKASGSNILDVQ